MGGMHLLGIITGTSLLLSVASAQFVDHFLIERVAVFGSFAGFQLSHNPGIAFGLRLPPVFQEILIGIALIIVGVIAVRATQKDRSGRKRSSATTRAAFGLILGGGIANIIDRIPDGLVTDFIQIGTFPTFNVADSCITIGAALLLWTSIRRPQESSNNAI